MKPAVLLSVFLLAGCSSLSWFGRPEPPPPSPSAGAYDEDEAAVAALESCKTQARAVIRRDTAIDRDIAGSPAAGGAPGLDWRSESEGDLIENMTEFEVGRRYERIVAVCMRQKGYGAPDEEPAS